MRSLSNKVEVGVERFGDTKAANGLPLQLNMYSCSELPYVYRVVKLQTFDVVDM